MPGAMASYPPKVLPNDAAVMLVHTCVGTAYYREWHARAAIRVTEAMTLHAGGVRPSLLIDCSTINPVAAAELAREAVPAARLHAESAHFQGCSDAHPAMVDAPVSGGVTGAAAASLTFMVHHA